jgi:hypothetical protein
LRVQEYFMSFSVNGSNANNPYALWQSLLQPDSSASTSAQSDPIGSLLAALGQGTATGATASSGNASSSSANGTTTSGSSAPQFGAQTLQTLFDMQANASNSQSLLSQVGGNSGSNDANSSPQAQQSDGHHRHHHMSGSGGAGGGQNPLDVLGSADSGATSQTAANANGSSTTTITYADGSTVALTTAAPSGSTSSASSNSSAGGTNVANNNLLERLIQMQAQLTNTATAQNVATA